MKTVFNIPSPLPPAESHLHPLVFITQNSLFPPPAPVFYNKTRHLTSSLKQRGAAGFNF
jgi:hypothetical protein